MRKSVLIVALLIAAVGGAYLLLGPGVQVTDTTRRSLNPSDSAEDSNLVATSDGSEADISGAVPRRVSREKEQQQGSDVLPDEPSYWFTGVPDDLASQRWLEANGFDTQMQRDTTKLMFTDPQAHSALADSGDIYALSQRATSALLSDKDAAADDYWKAALLGSAEALEKLGVMHVDPSLMRSTARNDSVNRQTILKGAAFLALTAKLTDGVAGAARLSQALVEHQITEEEFADVCRYVEKIASDLDSDRQKTGWVPHEMQKPPRSMSAALQPIECSNTR